MIKVHKIEVENIRSLGHAVFEPLIDGGMTAVNGPNGAGKSSLLHSMVWALYGVTPDGVVQQAMRRQGSEGTCRVIVEFETNGQNVTVERGLKGRNDTAYMLVHVDGVEQAKTPSTGTKYLLGLLGGLDAEGFMTAFVIRQKELDGLVKAKPAERRKLIERLAGIDRMSTAVKTARAEEAEVKNRLELLPGDPAALKAAKATLEAAQEAAIACWEAYEAATQNSDAAVASFADAEAAAKTMQGRLDAYAQVEREVTSAKHALALAQERHQGAVREVEHTTAAAQGGSPAEVDAAQKAFDAANSALQANKQAREGSDRAIETARRDAARAAQAQERADRARAAATQARTNADRAAERAAAFPTDLPECENRAEQELAEATQTVGSLRGEYERLTASIKAMEATSDGDQHCPTCATTLTDPSMVLASLRDARNRVAADGKSTGERVGELEARLRAVREQITQASTVATEAHHFAEQALAAEGAAAEAERDAAEAAEVAREALEQAEAAKAAAFSAAGQTAALVATVEQAADALRTAQVAAAAAARLPHLSQTADAAQQGVADTTLALERAQAEEIAHRVDVGEKETVFAHYQSIQQAKVIAEHAKVEANANFRVAEEQVRSAEKTRDIEDMRIRARAETFALLEQKTAVREALDFFRKDRIASLAPELSEIATDQIARMTDGKFVAVELDEEFTPVVTDAQGQQRPAAWLSGGEESAVALALRLAIGEVIAGSQGGLMWMDEPQTAMDASRRPAMMSVIRDLPGRQPIIISHVTEATDMVDHVVEVVPDEEDGSTVVVTTAMTGLDESVLDVIDA